MSKNHKFLDINASPESPTYKEEMQKQQPTFDVKAVPKGIPGAVTPVTKANPGLGGRSIAHPFKAGEPKA